MKQFLSVHDVPDIQALVNIAAKYKQSPRIDEGLGKHKRVGLLFLNPSLRTRISTQIAATNLGLETIVLNADKDSWQLEFAEGAIMNGSSVEHIKDAAPILGSYFDILCVRTFPQLKNRADDYSERIIRAFVQQSNIPVVSMESATLHPLQSLADMLTISEDMAVNAEKRPARPKVVLTWAPHVKALPQCVANSFAQWITTIGTANVVITHPQGFELNEEFVKGAEITHNQEEALEEADYIYVKNWSSYSDYGMVYTGDENWMLDNEKMKLTHSARVMHCLPVRRNVELSDEILDSSSSIVTQQAGNRVWAAQAVLSQILAAL